MPKLPNTPDIDRLRDLQPTLVKLEPGTTIHRIYRRGGPHPTLWNEFRYFGPTNARFDHHIKRDDGEAQWQDRGTLYAATDITTALAEVFQQKRLINRRLDSPWLVSAETAGTLTLLDLTDSFPLRAGASMKLISGATSHARAWSCGFYDAYPDIHGLYYPSSLTNRPVMILYERASEHGPFETSPKFHRALGDALLLEPLRNASREMGFDLI